MNKNITMGRVARSRRIRLAAGSILTVLLMSCGVGGRIAPAAPTATVMPAATETASATASPSPSPTVTASATQAPEPTPTPASPVIHIVDLQMIDDQTGWGVFSKSHDPKLFWQLGSYLGRTTDGGNTWLNITPPGTSEIWKEGDNLQLTALDAKNAWVLSACPGWKCNFYSPILWHTTDGGHTWQTISFYLPYFYPRVVQFADEQHGWMRLETSSGMSQAADSLYRTRDGGITWEPIPGGEGGLAISGYYPLFFNTDRGLTWSNPSWMNQDVSVKGNPVVNHWIKKSSDGGATWQWIPAPLPPEELNQGLWKPNDIEHACWEFNNTFVSLEPNVIGFLVKYSPCGMYGTGSLSAYQFSLDEGQTWNSLWSVGDSIHIDNMTGWQLSDQTTMALQMTTDGGRSWQPYPLIQEKGDVSGIFVRLKVAAISQDAVWLHPPERWSVEPRGESSVIVFSEDAGVTAKEIVPTFLDSPYWPGRGLRLESLHMDSPTSGWAMVTGGDSVCTQDGGHTWQPCPPPTEATPAAGIAPMDLKGDLKLDEPISTELTALFPNGMVPVGLQSALEASNRKFLQQVDKAADFMGYSKDDLLQGYSSGYQCSTQRVDVMEAGKVGFARMCMIYYPGAFVSDGRYDLLGFFENSNWYYYYYVLHDATGDTLWPWATSADFISEQAGWRQIALDDQGKFFEIQQTLDGGATWKDLDRVSWQAELEFASPTEGWAIAWPPQPQGSGSLPGIYRDPALVHTSNGGRTWEIIKPVVGP